MSGSPGHTVPQEIIRACRVLFESGFTRPVSFLGLLDQKAIKAAYRKQAMLHHPDRAGITGVPAPELAERFVGIHRAYEALSDYVGTRQRARAIVTGHKKSGTREGNASPQRRPAQPLGQYLYGRGLISFSTLVEAIAWQRRGRPSYGEIAGEMGLLSGRDLAMIQAARRPKERIGECAVRMGRVSSLTNRLIIERQARLQPPIGRFFIERGILTATELEEILNARRDDSSGAFHKKS